MQSNPESRGGIFIMDDDAQARTTLADMLTLAGYEVACFADGAPLLARARICLPLCVFLDVGMRDRRRFDPLDRLHAKGFRAPIFATSAKGNIAMAVEAIRKGAFDFIEKPFDDERLLSQVRAALETFDAGEPERAEPGVPLELLSSRQREVLQRVLDGKPSRQIAEELAISVKTVEFHRARIMQKLGVKTAAELFRRCLGAA